MHRAAAPTHRALRGPVLAASLPAPAHRGPRGPGLAVPLAVLALTFAAVGWSRHVNHPDEAGRGPATSASDPSVSGPVDPPVGRTAALPRGARPTHLEISSIDVSATITSLGIHPDRTVEVPHNPDQVGWYRLGSLPGHAGSAVILGHVDSTAGPAVFARLRLLRPGAAVEVISADRKTTRFEVTSIATYPNADFPAQKVYRTTGRPGLALVTCGGRYDAAHGGYQSNVVVFAALADTP